MLIRLEAFLKTNNPYDYQEFLRHCKNLGLDPISWLEYAQKAEAMIQARHKYPNLPIKEAYLKYIEDNQGHLEPTITEKEKPSCGTCGGGKVL